MEVKQNFNHDTCSWVNVDASKSHEVANLKKALQISDEMLNYALDKNERARVEYDETEQALLVIFNVPHLQKNDNHYETSPMAFIMKNQYFITFVNPRTEYVEKVIENLLAQDSQLTPASLLSQALFSISDHYFPLIDEVNQQRMVLNKKLRQKTTNKNLLAMSDLEIGLVYFITATRQNAVLLEQIKAQTIYAKFSDKEKEELDDVLIEAKQAVEMTKLASDILDQLSGTYNNLLNNNLNDTMKILTIWSLLLTIPTIVTGFFGMNVPLPFEDSTIGWLISLGISLILSVWLILLLWRRIK